MQYTSRLSVRIFLIFTFFSIALLLAGCSQTAQPNSCTTAQKNTLIKKTNQLHDQIMQKRQALIQTQHSLLAHNCRSAFFSPHSPAKICQTTSAKAQVIEAEMTALQYQASIYQAVINGQVVEHPSLSDGCAIIKKSAPKVKAPKSKMVLSKNTKTSATAPQQMVRHPLEDAQYTVYTPPASVKITHEIMPENVQKNEEIIEQAPNATGFMPVSQKTQPTATGAERPYQPDPKIRVIGLEFFPDQAAVTTPPTQDQNP